MSRRRTNGGDDQEVGGVLKIILGQVILRRDLLSWTDNVKFLHVDDDPPCFDHEVLDEGVRDYGDTDADEVLGTERCEYDVPGECESVGPLST